MIKIEKEYRIYLIIVIFTSSIVLPYSPAKTLDQVEMESNLLGQNVPSFDVGESPVSVAVDQDDKIDICCERKI